VNYMIGMVIAAVSAFIAAFVMKINEDEERKK
jgi:PTS system sucrose-specific IIC component